MRIRNVSAGLVLVLLIASVASAQENPKHYLNVDKHGLALQGYDPVGYFTQNKAVPGDEKLTSSLHGATYRFATAENKALFDADPAKYEPQFGGFCGYAVSKGYTAKIDPEAFIIQDGRLILQYSKSVLKKWNEDPANRLKSADSNWPKILDKNGK